MDDQKPSSLTAVPLEPACDRADLPTAQGDKGLAGCGGEPSASSFVGRKSVLMGMAASLGFVLANSSQPSATAATFTPTVYTPTWVPSMTYALGQQVISPNNDVVSAKVAHTSSVNYASDTAKWNLSSTYGRRSAMRPATVPNRPKDLRMVTTFQAGHPFFALAGGGSINTADTVNAILGSQCLTITTPGVINAYKTARAMGLPAADISGQQFALLVKVDNPLNLAQIRIYTGDSAFANSVVYHATLGSGGGINTALLANEWRWLYFTATGSGTSGSPNLRATTDWQIQARDKGTPVAVSFGAIGYFPRPAAFPNGVVSFAFDDCYLSQMTEARKKLDQYGYAASAFVIVDSIGLDPEAFTQNDLDRLHDLHSWDVSGHAFTNANHNVGFSKLSAAQLDDELFSLKDWLSKHGYRGADLFAYPLGDDQGNVPASVGHYFSVGRHTYGSPRQALGVDQRLRLRAFTVTNTTTAAALRTEIDNAYTHGIWLILLFHDIVPSAANATIKYLTTDFAAVVDKCATKGIPVKTMTEVLKEL